MRLVYEIRKEMDIDILGVGGIENSRDALEYIMAGANAYEIGTALIKYGRNVFAQVEEGIRQYMKESGIKSLKELVGVAVR